jgi:hypothetical protein
MKKYEGLLAEASRKRGKASLRRGALESTRLCSYSTYHIDQKASELAKASERRASKARSSREH